MTNPRNALRLVLLASTVCLSMISAAPAQTAPPLVPAPSSTPTPPPVVSLIVDTFFSGKLMPANWRASDAMNEPVHNLQKEKIGEVNDLVIDGDGKVVAAVIGIGGFLGMGEKDVAINIRAVRMNHDEKGKTLLVLDVSKDALKAAPAYKPMKTAKSN
jgi:PRC-barrel domain